VLYSKKSFVGVERALRVTRVVFLEGKVAQIPISRFISMEVLPDAFIIEPSIDTNVIYTAIVWSLVQTLHEQIAKIGSSLSKLRLNSQFHLGTVRGS